MATPSPRLAVRAILLHEGRILMVNAYPNGKSDLLTAPGGGAERHASLPDNLRREVMEETGLDITVGAPCLVNEFHDPGSRFHQVDIYFRCALLGGPEIAPGWQDKERIVSEWHWLSAQELATRRHKPDSLVTVAFGQETGVSYDPLEPIVR